MSNQGNNSTPVCNAGIPFKFPEGYKPGDFLYGDRGPWPSKPSGNNPCSIAPEVQEQSIPKEEWGEWAKHVGKYYDDNKWYYGRTAAEYAVTILGIAKPDAWEVTKLAEWAEYQTYYETLGTVEPYPDLNDALFTDLIAHGLLSKLLCKLDEPDEVLFKDYLKDDSKEYWKSDATHMRAVRTPYDDEYLAPAIVLLSLPKNRDPGGEFDFQVVAIALFGQARRGGFYDKQPRIFKPGDGKAWQLAKYFALQGALIRINLIDHPMVHFPPDAINAITKTALPKSNLVLQLLLPHLYLSLPVDNSVLEGKYSLINRTASYPYSPYPAKGEEIRKVFPFYWAGSDFYLKEDDFWVGRKNAFPKYSFRLQPREVPSRYCTFLSAFYEPILNFTRQVVQCIPNDAGDRDREEIRTWADYVASWIPGFPNGEQMSKEPDTLAKSLASVIWNVAVVHSADHYLMHAMLEAGHPTPYVMRDQPPVASTQDKGSNYRATAAPKDVSAARFCDLLFFMPHNTTLLIDCPYDFRPNIQDAAKRAAVKETLEKAVATFRQELRATAERLRKENLDFGIKLESRKEEERDHQCFCAGVQY